MTPQPPSSAVKPVQRLESKLRVSQDGEFAIDVLFAQTPLSRQKLKDAMTKGAIWLNKATGARRRLRRAKTKLIKGDILELYYDARILATQAPEPRLIADQRDYSVWYKPQNMFSQGSKFADHCAITRWVEKNHHPRRAVYLVHRLDRAASGLMLLAHNQQVAAKLSTLFSTRNIKKRYSVSVAGNFDLNLPRVIDHPIDGKSAHSTVLQAKPGTTQTKLVVEIKTGRKHQIRRHLSALGWPVLGDRLYGDKQQTETLQLVASYLAFICPVSNAPVEYRI